MTDSLRAAWRLLQLSFVARFSSIRHTPNLLPVGELMLSRLASRSNAGSIDKINPFRYFKWTRRVCAWMHPIRRGSRRSTSSIQIRVAASFQVVDRRARARLVCRPPRDIVRRHPRRVPWIMHIFRDMSAWVMARHVALTGCKLEWENLRRRPRPCIAISASYNRRSDKGVLRRVSYC